MSHLVVTRRPGEAIRIGADIFVTIEVISGQQVRVSIDAPRHIPIVRTELDGRPPREASTAGFIPHS